MAKVEVNIVKQLKNISLAFEESESSIGYDYLICLSEEETEKLIKDLTEAKKELIWQKPTI
jgi:hypothetical protein